MDQGDLLHTVKSTGLEKCFEKDIATGFLKWEPCHFLVMATCFVVLIFFNKFASCFIPYFNFLGGRPSFGLKQFVIVHLFCVPSSFLLIHQKKKKKGN